VVASEGLGVWGGLWIQVMGDLLLPLMADLARYVSTRYREFPGVCVCVFMMASCNHLLTHSFTHYSFTHSFTHSCTHLIITHFFFSLFIYALIHLSICPIMIACI